MTDLNVRLFGQFQVTLDGKAVTKFSSDKVRALFAYLIADAQRPHRRETLAFLLWPDKPLDSARNNLRQALSNMRKAIMDSRGGPSYLHVNRQTIQWNVDGPAWVDVRYFQTAYDLLPVSNTSIGVVEQAVDAYQGDFLEGFNLPKNSEFHEWTLVRREQYARQATSLLSAVVDFYEMELRYDEAVAYAWRLVGLNPWDESRQRQLLHLLALAGQRGAALSQYERLAVDLKASLGVGPEKATSDLYESIKDEQYADHEGRGIAQPLRPLFFLDQESHGGRKTRETFVGRKDELAGLEVRLSRMLSGEGQVALIVGEAGIGKTFLMKEFAKRTQVRDSDVVVAGGSCTAYSSIGDPYQPFREIMESLTGDVEASWRAGMITQSQARKLWKIMPHTVRHLSQSGPELIGSFIAGVELLKRVRLNDSMPKEWTNDLESMVRRKHEAGGANIPMQISLFSQYTRVMQLVSQHAPLILFLDDLQWADSGTISLLFHMSRHLAGHRILVMGAFRPEDAASRSMEEKFSLPSIVRELQREYGDILVDLNHSRGELFVEALLESESNHFDQAFRGTLFRQTKGHALFTVEALEEMKARGDIWRNERGEWVAKPDLNWNILPPRVEGVIAERTGRLPDRLRKILTVASVQGESFTAELVADVLGLSIFDTLESLSGQLEKQHGLIKARRVERVNDRQFSIYRFHHSLFHAYIYGQLDDVERVNWHAKVGNAMEILYGTQLEGMAAQLAHHFQQAGEAGKAIDYWRTAGERARLWSANQEAVDHYNRALSLLAVLPESRERDLTEIVLRLGQGASWHALQGFGAEIVGRAYNRAWDLCQKIGDSPLIFDALGMLISYYFNLPALKTAEQVISAINKLARDQNDTMRILQGHWVSGYLSYLYGHFPIALGHFEEALRLFDPEKHAVLGRPGGLDVGSYCNGWAAINASFSGYINKGEDYWRTALNWAERSTNHMDLGIVYWQKVVISYALDDDCTFAIYAEKLSRLAQEDGFIFYQTFGNVFQGLSRVMEERTGEGLEGIQQGLGIADAIGMQALRHVLYTLAAKACSLAGSYDEGLQWIEKAETAMKDSGEGILKSNCLVIKGQLSLGLGWQNEAETCFRLAVEVAQEQSARTFELKAVLELAGLFHSQGRDKQADDVLRPIFEWFTEGLESPLLLQARSFLDTLVISN